MALTLTEANRMVQAALAKAQELNVTISVAVCDTGGHLVALHRMDGASAVSATVAQGKAAASAGFGRASGTLQADSPVIQAVIAALGGRMLPARGAVPIVKSHAHLDAIGARGAIAAQGELCAQAGAALLSARDGRAWSADVFAREGAGWDGFRGTGGSHRVARQAGRTAHIGPA
jgi:glc operon protein GlcG